MRRLQASELLLAITSLRQIRSIPGKLYEYWAIGRAPILTIDDAGYAPAEFMNKHGLGTVVIGCLQSLVDNHTIFVVVHTRGFQVQPFTAICCR